ncbi:BspA family leucine-rich repeat surface protein [Aequorivita sp. H23M31]|uniref:BspA family leucine-rich repeat surface protein n=1 Tax=Aequorivita ciconiae TaxID=2494375 RepID=A0A410G1F5_9FLAO|nr:BspA family leucine-rich repeat surface protein [Aequorivita sp. H23M31]QAA81106.1 BspA family leucine-rich repeat surface protein [Aequorivita sp. H23M31]
MKKLLFFLLFCCLAISGLQAQTITWTGAVNDLYNNPNNWNPAQVPTAANDVIIPTGSTMTINVGASVKSIKVQGTSTVTINNNLQFTHASSFSSNTTVYWNNSSLYGGGTLTNNGTVNLTTGASRYISGPTTINNNGLFTMPAGGYLYLYDTSVFNNTVSGTFDLQSDAGLSYNGTEHSFINAGLFKKSAGSGSSLIQPILTNTGTIAVESGTMDMYYHAKYFNGGVYNVTADGVLKVSTTGMNISGTLTGNLDGPLYWTGNFSVPDTATFDFTGDTGVSWASGSLIGGGTLTNESTINLVTGSSRYISGGTTLENIGLFTMPAGGYLYLYDTSVFNNTVSGTFDLQSDAGVSYNGTEHSFINAGLFKKSAGSGTSLIYPILTNTGTIAVESGTMDMYYHAKYFNGGVYNVTADGVLKVSTTGMNISGTLTGNLDGPLYWTGNFSVPDTATFDFTGDTGVSWASGSLIGGGTLTNESTINLVTGTSRYISGGTTLENIGLFTMPAGGYLYLYDTSVFNNTVSGTFDLQSDAWVSYNGTEHSFINAGLFKKSAGSGTSLIYPILTNTGTIAVESGSMDMYYHAKYFNGGVYNVSAGSSLICSSSGMNISGTLTGTLDGPLVWTGNFSVATTATFDFAGTSGVNWNSGDLFGGGILTNASTLNLSTAGSRYISGTVTTLANTGTINFPDGGNLYLYNDTALDNKTTGVIDFQSNATISYNGSGAFKITNAGTITKSEGTGVTYIYPPVTNSGTINVLTGELEFADNFGLNNTIDGVIKGTATIDLPSPANFTNDGTFAPGGSPGMLTVLGTYKSTSSSVLDVEINGLAAGTEYDQLVITGTNAIFEGTVNVDLGFEANVGDSFTIATVSGIIVTKNLASPVFTVYGCREYTFSVSYPADKSVVLTVTNKGEVQPPQVETQNITVQLDVNGEVSITPEQIDNGSGAGCAEGGELTFSLDQTDFTCADIGNNTVVLTVTDENGNSASGTAIVTVEDDMAPSVMAQNITVNLDASGSATIAASDIDSGSTDNCSIASRTLDMSTFNCSNIGTNTVTLTVTDQSGNSNTATVSVTITDSLGACNEAPVAVCLALTMDANADCQGEATARDFDGGSYDPNGNPLTFTLTPIGPFGEGTTQVTLTVSNGTDSDSCTTTITVVDNTPPVANCAAPFTVQLDANGQASISVSDIDNGSTDYCGIMSTSIDVTDFGCGNIGENTVTLTVVDIGGNISTCSTVVTVTDPLGACNESPVNDNCANAIPFALGEAGIIGDNTGATPDGPVMDCAFFDDPVHADVWFSFVAPESGNLTIQTSKIDGSNMGDSQMQILDGCGGNILGCSEDEGAGLFSLIELLCGEYTPGHTYYVQIDSYGLYNNGPFKLTATVDGACAPCEAPELTVYASDSLGSPIDCLNAGDQYYVNVGVSGGSGNDSYTLTDNNGNELTNNLTTNYIAGPYAQTDSVSFTIVGNDNDSCSVTSDMVSAPGPCDQTPVAVCQAVIISSDTNCQGQAVAADFDGGSTDPQGAPLTFTIDPVGPYNVGVTEVTLTVSNGTNSASCTTTVTVVDDTLPVANCAAPFTVQLDESGNASITVDDIDNGSADNCGIASMAIDLENFNCEDVGENNITLTVTDNSGNVSSCTTVVTVEDALAPTVIVQDITVSLDSSGNASIVAADIDNGSYDNCSIATIVLDIEAFTCDNIGANQVALTVTDINGNSASATATVTVQDPLLACGTVAPGDYFITTWRTTVSNESITIPTFLGETYNYSVNWGDGSTISGYTGDATHTYSATGTYTVSISGSFPRIFFNNTAADRMKIKSIEQWGTNVWTSMNGAFAGAGNLVSNATDMPDLSMVTDMYGMFAYARKFNGDANFGNWDVSNVTNMYGMFGGASIFNYPIGGWNVSNVTDMGQMFHGATRFNQDLGAWDVGNVTSMQEMFFAAMRFNAPIGGWDVGNVTNMARMFYHTNRFDQDLGAWDVSKVTDMNNMFKNVTLSTENYDALLNGWSALTLKHNVKFHGGNSKYCAGEPGRIILTSAPNNWTITDGGKDCGVYQSKLDGDGSVLLSEVTLYPNPMKDQLNLGNPDGVELESVTIFDLTGRLVEKVELKGITSGTIIDVSRLSSATYMIIINAENGRKTELLIKE